MGLCASGKVGDSYKDESEIDRQLREEKERAERTYKVLLLGAGESGKSTVIKQVKILYKTGISAEEAAQYTKSIRNNAVECMAVLLEACGRFELPVDGEHAARKEVVDQARKDNKQLDEAVADAISKLWTDCPSVAAAFARRNEFWLLDACPYYMDNVARFAEEDFSATEEDQIMARVRTTGISVTEFTDRTSQSIFQMVDVAGQRSGRKKWIHCFDDVKAIIFLVGLSGYHQVLFEDGQTNRLMEALELFEEIVGRAGFATTPIFLFLNKKDLFEAMMQNEEVPDLSACFPDYEGGRDMKAAVEFITQQFATRLEKKTPSKRLHTHVVAARVRMDMKIAMADVKNAIIANYQQQLAASPKGSKR